MESNWSSNFGRPLQIWTDAEWGRQYARASISCARTAENASFELKRGKSSDRVVGQTLRYMGWVREQLAGTAA